MYKMAAVIKRTSMISLPRQATPAHGCKATQEALERAGKTVIKDCPICLSQGINCYIGCHPSSQPPTIPAVGK